MPTVTKPKYWGSISTTYRIQLEKTKIEYINHLMEFSADTSHLDVNRGVLNSTSLIEVVNFSLEKQALLHQELAALESEQAALALAALTIDTQLSLLSAPNGHHHEAKLSVVNRNAENGLVELSYLVTQCGWSPQYTLHANVGDEVFSLRYFAIVEQLSGESWENVALRLSTASPSLSAAGPSLTPFRVSIAGSGLGNTFENSSVQAQAEEFRQQMLAVESEFAAKNSDLDDLSRDHALNAVANSLQNMELVAEAKELKTLAADAKDDVASQSYSIAQTVTLESRRETQQVQIIHAKLAGSLYHVATPLLSSFAYREAECLAPEFHATPAYSVALQLSSGRALGSTVHWHGHHVVGGSFEFEIAAPVQVELPWLAAAEAESEESIFGQESDWADNANGLVSLGINIFQAQDQFVLTLHGGT